MASVWIGSWGLFAVDEDIQRHLTLKRAGWDIYRIPYDKWANNRETCLKEISLFFHNEISKAS